MKRRSTSRRHSGSSQSGYFFAIAAVIIVVLFIIVGLAVDSAQLYRAKLRIQRAYDAGAIAGSKLSGTPNVAQGGALARQVTMLNLQAMGYPTDSVIVNAGWSDPPANSIMQVNGSVALPLWFLRIFPSMSDPTQVAGVAQAASKKSVIVLVLDVTGSMAEMAGGIVKLDALKSSAKNFIGLFQPGFDYMGIVTFSDWADVPPGGEMATNFAGFNGVVDGLVAGGWTNTELALWMADKVMTDTIAAQPGLIAANKAIVVVTDGAPTRSCKNGTLVLAPDPALEPNNRPYQCELTALNQNDSGKKRNYDKALIQADRIRAGASGVAVYTIGIGELGSANLELSDAYQDFNEAAKLKSNFLRRMANVSPPGNVEPGNYFGPNNPADPFYIRRDVEYNPATPPPGVTNPTRGIYLGTANAGELNALFTDNRSGIKRAAD